MRQLIRYFSQNPLVLVIIIALGLALIAATTVALRSEPGQLAEPAAPGRLENQVPIAPPGEDEIGDIVPDSNQALRPDGPPGTPAPEPYDYDPELRAEIEAMLNRMPAFQEFPYQGGGIFADFTDQLPDGRVVVEVVYTGSRAGAAKSWQEFLTRNNDSGEAYIVLFRAG